MMKSINHGHPLHYVLSVLILVSITTAVVGHQHTAVPVDQCQLENGLYIKVNAPHVIRQKDEFDVQVSIMNLNGEGDIFVHAIRYTIQNEKESAIHPVQQNLPSCSTEYGQYLAVDQQLRESLENHDRASATKLSSEYQTLVRHLSQSRLVDRFHLAGLDQYKVGDSITIEFEIDITQAEKQFTLHRDISVPVRSPLPDGQTEKARYRFDIATGTIEHDQSTSSPRINRTDLWFAGDQHLHTAYSLDAFVLNGTTETVTGYAQTAELIGLDWIIITDHSNVHVNWFGTEYYTPEQFQMGTLEAVTYALQNNYLVLYSEEMGLGQAGFWNLPSHMLAYPADSYTTGYLENPSSGLMFGIANCEPEQVIIDRINDAGGLGFIAHPFDEGALAFAQWDFDNGATGWAGLEIFSDTNGVFKDTDEASFTRWHELLNEIYPPANGELAVRPDYPTLFPVGLGNSDAHEPGLIGKTFTYANIPEPTRINVISALTNGQCVATNGPLVYGNVNRAGTGEIALLFDHNPYVEIFLESTEEFGPVGDYEIKVYVDGQVRTTIPPSGSPEYAASFVLDGFTLAPPDTFVTIRTDSVDGTFHAIANPIWLQFTCAGDLDGSGTVNIDDIFAVLGFWGDCDDPCPPYCTGDLTEDCTVNIDDIFSILGQWGSCE